MYIIVGKRQPQDLTFIKELRDKFFIQILDVENSNQTLDFTYDCYFMEESLVSQCFTLIKKVYPKRAIQIFKINHKELKQSFDLYVNKLWDWIVENETGVK